MLARINKQNVIDLIDRAVSSDQKFPEGDGYFIRTTHRRRSTPRYKTFINTVDSFNRADALVMNYIDNSTRVTSGNYISNSDLCAFAVNSYVSFMNRLAAVQSGCYAQLLPGLLPATVAPSPYIWVKSERR